MLESANSMDKAGNFLGGVVRRMRRPEAAIAWLTSMWPKIVGKALAARTRPLRCENGCLEIAADNKAWRKQLEDMKLEFCARINQAWGGKLIREVRFVAAKPGPKHISHEFNNEHTPFVRRGKR
jgi:predicted nucleic acid-binding Zn ribbon protein